MRAQSSTPDPRAPASWDAYLERVRYVETLGPDAWPMCGWWVFKALIEEGKWNRFCEANWPGDERMRMEGEENG